MAEIVLIRRETLFNQLINQSINHKIIFYTISLSFFYLLSLYHQRPGEETKLSEKEAFPYDKYDLALAQEPWSRIMKFTV